MTPIRLTAEEVRELDEIRLDKQITEITLNLHINFVNNRLAELSRQNDLWWKRLRLQHELDPECEYTIDTSGLAAVIVEVQKPPETTGD
jgi:hypothetical protein